MNRSHKRWDHWWAIYVPGVFTALILFALHTFVIYRTALFLSIHDSEFIAFLGKGIAEPILILIAFFVLFITHLAEAAIWAALFLRSGQFEDYGACMYFTGTSLTALGYGDIVLRPPWRALGPVMAINGLLMFGCSTAFLFLTIQHAWKIL